MRIFKKIVSVVLRLSVSIILVVLLFKFNKIDIRNLLGDLKGADKGLLLLALAVFFFTYVLCLYRWEMLLKALDFKLPLKRVIISFSGGVYSSLLLPSTVGGDFTRSIDLGVHTKRPRAIVATVLLDRLSGYVGLAILVLFSLFLGWGLIKNDKSVLISVAVIILILVVILAVLFNTFLFSRVNKLLNSPKSGKFRESLRNLHEEMHVFRNNKKVILMNIILSLFIQAVTPISSYIIALSLGIKMNLIYFFIFLPIIGAITLLPISIGGLGLRENMTVLFLAKAGVAKSSAVAISLINFSFIVVYACIGGLIYVFGVRHRRLQRGASPVIRPD
ncbi:MAG: lysylphosphatidylglycerol synthase transmembrane domain-containing protein [Candidatus Omnitrophica bacterium]|nr:lysylphosphatidylglycerol synthase transmembrane domain-containing protein [Candidatus Omnitrophota bacterium]